MDGGSLKLRFSAVSIEVESGKWKVESGKWKVESGKGDGKLNGTSKR
ncbi:hypothetical protein HQQ94_07145 [Shewanella sp. VB17]|nr:hypothetical protein [Shewanella sp. VB17]NRD73018.1 hypothetical protein [Shewanella sp. VB17]